MFVQQREVVHPQMQQVLLDYMGVVEQWLDKETGAIEDRWDSIYGENYTAGTAAVMFANGYAFSGNPRLLETALQLIQRTTVRIQDMKVAPFARMFIYHYGMMALLMLPEEARNKHKDAFAEAFLHGEPKDCGTINLNCAALQLGNELFIEQLGYRKADTAFMEMLIDLMEKREYDGFLNDAFDHRDQENFSEHDGMPIAYSAFILFILTSVLTAVNEWRPELLKYRERVEALIEKGQAWFNHATSTDGTYAMMERSRHQMFTWGSLMAYQSYAGMADSELYQRMFQFWLQFKKEDGTYSMTPNFLPHELRSGYEWYTLVNCYGILGMTGLTVAERIVRLKLAMTRANERQPLPARSSYVDPRSGYAFVRSGDDFFGVNLRVHHGQYAPALCGFHYRLQGQQTLLAEPRLNPQRVAGTVYYQGYELGPWEGFLLRDEQGNAVYPSSRKTPATEWVEDGITMRAETEQYSVTKTIRLTGAGIEWTYTIKAHQAFKSCEHIVPILMTDGKNGTRIERRLDNGWRMSYAGRTYEIVSDECDNVIRTPEDVYAVENNLSYERSLYSVSGVSANLSMRVSGALQAGEELTWRTVLSVQ